jgi:hypothetical protein
MKRLEEAVNRPKLSIFSYSEKYREISAPFVGHLAAQPKSWLALFFVGF